MRTYKEMYEKYNKKELSEKETELLSLIESLTDECIDNQFRDNRQISVPYVKVNNLLNEVGFRRKEVIIKIWKSKYEVNGWKITTDTTYNSNNDYLFYPSNVLE
jgi:hypothetical protein